MQHLSGGIVEIFFVAAERAHLGEKRNAHVRIVGPDGVFERRGPRQGAIIEPKLSATDVTGDVVDGALEIRSDIAAASFHQRGPNRAAIVQRSRMDQIGDFAAMLFDLRFVQPGDGIGEHLKPCGVEIGEGFIARGIRGGQHPGINHPHRIADQGKSAVGPMREPTRRERRVGGGFDSRFYGAENAGDSIHRRLAIGNGVIRGRGTGRRLGRQRGSDRKEHRGKNHRGKTRRRRSHGCCPPGSI